VARQAAGRDQTELHRDQPHRRGGRLLGHLAATAVVAAGVAARGGQPAPGHYCADAGGRAAYLIWLGTGMLARPSFPQASLDELTDSRARSEISVGASAPGGA